MKIFRILLMSAIFWTSQSTNPCPDEHYFGPDCLYINLRPKVREVFVNDQDDVYRGSECIDVPKGSMGKVNMMLPKSENDLTWIRVDLNDNSSTSKLSITLFDDEEFPIQIKSERRFISNFTVDVQFEVLGGKTRTIVVEGSVDSNCDIYISGGQNLGLRYGDKSKMSGAHVAEANKCVDNDRRTACHTNEEYFGPAYIQQHSLSPTLNMKKVRILLMSAIFWTSQSTNPCPDEHYFGPDCLYINLRPKVLEVFVNDQTDGYPGSQCIDVPQGSMGKVNMMLPKRENDLTWIRVDLNDNSSTSKLSVTLFDDEESPLQMKSERRFISNFTVDVQFEILGGTIRIIVVQGSVGSTCNIYISGGQSLGPRYGDKSKMSGAHVAEANKCVDNDRRTACHTNEGEEEAWWLFDFPFPAKIYSVFIDNHDFHDHISEYAIGHSIYIFDDYQRLVWNVTDTLPGMEKHYGYNVYTSAFAAQLKIVNSPNHARNGHPKLNYKEIEMWGDYICGTSKFGPDCLRDCNCRYPGEQCFKNSGGCPSGCAIGFGGLDCHTECGSSCAQICPECTLGCNDKGSCLKCPAGFRGESCDEKCPAGKFGADCEETCPENCQISPCNSESGACNGSLCLPGWTGPMCNGSCPEGSWGDNCQQKCSDYCAGNGDCESTKGACAEGCKDGYVPPLCVVLASVDQSSIGSNLVPLLLVVPIALFIIGSVWFFQKRQQPPRVSEKGYVYMPLNGTAHLNKNDASKNCSAHSLSVLRLSLHLLGF